MVKHELGVRQVVAWLRPVQIGTCVALWVTFAFAWWARELDLPLGAIGGFGFAAAALRTIALVDARPVTVWKGFALAADAALLTALLDITGGPFNPFIVMYGVYVWLAAVTSSPLWTVMVLTVAAGSFGWLVVDHLQAGLAEHHRLNDFPTHLFTMWFTGASVAELIAHYVMRARTALARQQEEVDHARERAARSERLASLMTLAAGAAHELATPLATIAVAARELERSAAQSTSPNLVDDAKLIQSAVQRCQAILDGMSDRAPGGVMTTGPMTVEAIAELAGRELTVDRQRRLRCDVTPGEGAPAAAGINLARALSSLLKNAFDASHADGEVWLRVVRRPEALRFEVEDRGHGMSEEIRRRVGEPFFTTRPQGEGLGLGVFLARAIAEQAGGSLQFETREGTIAILEVPSR